MLHTLFPLLEPAHFHKALLSLSDALTKAPPRQALFEISRFALTLTESNSSIFAETHFFDYLLPALSSLEKEADPWDHEAQAALKELLTLWTRILAIGPIFRARYYDRAFLDDLFTALLGLSLSKGWLADILDHLIALSLLDPLPALNSDTPLPVHPQV